MALSELRDELSEFQTSHDKFVTKLDTAVRRRKNFFWYRGSLAVRYVRRFWIDRKQNNTD